uniref:Uncharacterized protein n=1 Tax=Arundo donax TaxID=35708 RepID=A0A0A9BZE8_ARUDO
MSGWPFGPLGPRGATTYKGWGEGRTGLGFPTLTSLITASF